MAKGDYKTQNESIHPFMEFYLDLAKTVMESNNEEKQLITEFADRFNNSNIPKRYKFKSIGNSYIWSYKKNSIDLIIEIVKVTEFSVTLKCKRNRNIAKEIEIVKPPYKDIYKSVYQFLIDTVENAITLADAEANMKF